MSYMNRLRIMHLTRVAAIRALTPEEKNLLRWTNEDESREAEAEAERAEKRAKILTEMKLTRERKRAKAKERTENRTERFEMDAIYNDGDFIFMSHPLQDLEAALLDDEWRVPEVRERLVGLRLKTEKMRHGTQFGATPPPAPAGRRSKQDMHILKKNAHQSVIRKKGRGYTYHYVPFKHDLRYGKRNGARRSPTPTRYRGETAIILRVEDSLGLRTFSL